MDKLKPCPFCGEKAEIVVISDSPSKLGRHNKVRCLKCYAQSGIRYYSRDEAIKAWNTRYVDPARIEVDGNEMSIAVYCAEKYGARQAQDKTAIILDYLWNSTDV